MEGYPSERSPGALPQQAGKGSAKETLRRIFSKRNIKPTSLQNNAATPNAIQSGRLPIAISSLDAPDSPVLPSASTADPAPHARKPLLTDQNLDEGPLISESTTFDGGNVAPLRRFIALQGGHEHHLEPRLRQETLLGLLKKLLSKDQPSELLAKYGKCREEVGYGTSGIVRITHKKKESGTGEELYAVKEFQRRSREAEDKYIRRLTAECCIVSELRHPNVIRTLELLTDAKGNYCQVMEYCEGGDLFTLVHSARKLEIQEADCFFKQMMRGVEYMHGMGVVHRDLKPENLLLTRNGGLKISDFGNSECFRMAWENDVHMVSGLCGSGPYIAPEVYMDQEYDGRAVDVWACGVVYMAMRTGSFLWKKAEKDEDELFAQYLEERRQEEGFSPIESLSSVGSVSSCLALHDQSTDV
ncbi:serine/threonine-protein kinase HAL4/sat4 [Fusarium solani]|nr:serine/threonine-protein kinase HAL4/sat4 [Fusarium solani]